MKKLLTNSLALGLLATLLQAKLLIYCPSTFASEYGPGPKIAQMFKEQTGEDVEYLTLSSATLIKRLQTEGEQSSADLVLGLDATLVKEARDSALFEAMSLELPPLKLPIAWDDPVFLPYYVGYFALVYNEKRVKNPPKNWDEFFASPYTLTYADPRTSIVGLGLLSWLKHENKANWQALASRTLTVTKGWSESYALFTQGEADFVFSYDTSPLYHALMDNDPSYKAAIFDQGHYLQIGVAAMLKNSKQKPLAQDFVKLIFSSKAQGLIAELDYVYPVAPAQMEPKVQAAYDAAPKIKGFMYSPEQVAAQRAGLIEEWQNAAIK